MQRLLLLLLLLTMSMAARAEGPLTLDDAIRRARAQAPAVGTAEAQALVARMRIETAKAARLPSVSASLSSSTGLQNSHALLGAEDVCTDPSLGVCGKATAFGNASVGVGVDARWTLFDFGRTGAQIAAAEAGADAAAFDIEAVRDSAALQAALAFQSVAAFEQLLTLREDIVESRERALHIAEERVRVGVGAPIEATRARVSLETARVDIASAQAGLADARATLARALGLELDATLAIDAASTSTLRADDTPARAAELALQHRAELRARRHRVVQAEQSVVLAGAQRWPTIAATAGANARTSGATTNYVANANEGASIGLSISLPIFDAATGAQQQVADASLAAERAAAREQEQSIRAEATASAYAVQTQKQSLKATEALRTQADANLALAEGRYAAGAGSLLELTDAQAQQASAALSVVTARLQLASAQLRLLASTGTIGDG